MRISHKLVLPLAVAILTTLLMARPAAAHPMGNFSINHYAKIIPGAETIELDYIIDMAEIPTFQETESDGLVARIGDPSIPQYLARQDDRLRNGLVLQLGEQPLHLETISRQAIFPPGAGGLPTMKMGFVYRARLPHRIDSIPLALHYRDDNFPGRAGWKEVIAIDGPGAALVNSSAPTQDRSLELTNYPTDMLHSPPQALAADLTVKAAPPGTFVDPSHTGWLITDGGASGTSGRLAANRQGTPRSAFTELITSNRSDALFLLVAALIAAVLGGFHALEPGHGKTLVAAYLVGSRGTARHAVLLGAVVTASHTISVYALGIITLYASQWIMPEQLYPWLGAASGLLVAGIGFGLFIRRYMSFDAPPEEHRHAEHHHHPEDQPPHVHGHQHHEGATAAIHRHTWWGGHVRDDHADSHGSAQDLLHYHHHDHSDRDESENHDYAHTHSPSHIVADADSQTAAGVSLKSLFALGITGGIVPCPAALVVLLGALALHRIAFGLFLIVAFSAGLAAVLIGFGLAMVYAQRFMARFGAEGPLVERWLPLASSAVITVVGLALTLSALTTTGVLRGRL
ncbi:MAG: sulfite exporter TauE/SafE family protein [Candidatus Binataceae bacterium]|nr:sulfite exporter TauE/SafE family protein [Candidatus Binataceae bacterium]